MQTFYHDLKLPHHCRYCVRSRIKFLHTAPRSNLVCAMKNKKKIMGKIKNSNNHDSSESAYYCFAKTQLNVSSYFL